MKNSYHIGRFFRPEVCFSLFLRSSSFVFRNLLKIPNPPPPTVGGAVCFSKPLKLPRGIICGRGGAAFIPPVGKPRPNPAKDLRPAPGGFASCFRSREGFYTVGG